MELSEIKKGMIVKSKTSGQEMIVNEIRQDKILCSWFCSNTMFNHLFKPEQLMDNKHKLFSAKTGTKKAY
jgi:uncharacterized protein YodC (DUF2158 family)